MTSPQKWSFFVLVILIGTIFEYTAGQGDSNETDGPLRCYSCADTGDNNRCDDFDTYKDAMDGVGDDNVKKNCTAPYNVNCAIETYQTLAGSTAAHIRDCSDGNTFAFNAFVLDRNGSGAYTRLHALNSNNETACVWDGTNLVCLTLCNTDFCNGPRLKELTNGSQFLAPSLFLSFLLFLFSKKMIM